jgi:FAD synthase
MTYPAHSGPWPLIQFRNHFSQPVGLRGRVINTSEGRYLNTGQHKQRINAYTHETSMTYVGFEPTIPASERAKTVHALDREATVTGQGSKIRMKLFYLMTSSIELAIHD